jgi:hypothetical protein
LSDIPRIKNPFSKLQIASYENIGETDEIFLGFLESCRFRGATNALKRRELDTRKKLEWRLKGYKARWWEPDVLWAQLPRVIDEIKYPQLIQAKKAA